MSGEGSERVLVGDSCMRACVRADDFTAFRSSCGLSPVGRRSVRPNRTERYIYGRHAAAAAAAASRVPPRSGTLDDDCTAPVKKKLHEAVAGCSEWCVHQRGPPPPNRQQQIFNVLKTSENWFLSV